MNSRFEKLCAGFHRTGNLETDVQHFLTLHGCLDTAEHTLRVAAAARELAQRFKVDEHSAFQAACLHDISAVIPNQDRIEAARELGICVLPEEETFPLIVHQKLSKVMAQELFGLEDQLVLSAIECHTTLKPGATKLDQVLFVADKLEWDQAGTPPYLKQMIERLRVSLEHAAFAYIDYLWQRKETLKVVHPWLAAAYTDLKQQLHAEAKRVMYQRVNVVSAIIFDQAKENILMVKNQNGSATYWSLPGGAVEEGETLEAALIREIHEETGLNVEIEGIYSVREVLFEERKQHALLFTFMAKEVRGELNVCDPDHEIVDVKWMDLYTAHQHMPYLHGNLEIRSAGRELSPYYYHGME